jgi:CRISPR-associated protein Cst2
VRLFAVERIRALFRWTDDFAPRLLYGFTVEGDRLAVREEVRHRIGAGDIAANELVVGGTVAVASDGNVFKSQGASVFPGVKAAGDEIKRRIRADLGLK